MRHVVHKEADPRPEVLYQVDTVERLLLGRVVHREADPRLEVLYQVDTVTVHREADPR